MRSAAALLLCALLVAGAPGVGAQSGGGLDPGITTIDVYVQADGDARWNISTRFAINSSADRAAFRNLAADVESGGDGPGFDVGVARELAAAGESRTGRSMRIAEVDRSARLVGENESAGVVSVAFTWTNFSATDRGTIRVGDAFSEWTLQSDQRLRLHTPANYGLNDVHPDPTSFGDNTLTWAGEHAFATGEPTITLSRSLVPTPTETTLFDPPTDTRTATRTSTETNTATAPPPGGSGGVDLGFVLAVGGALLLGGVAAYAVANRDQVREAVTAAGSGSADEPEADDAATTPDADAAETGGAVDPELLSDEERVERLLESEGGRMKQADIVSETGWSNAKVSQLLSSMEEAGQVEKLRIGRENLISLPDAADEDGDE